MKQSAAKPSAGRTRVRARLTRIHKSRRQGVLGIAEIVGLGIAGFTILAVLVGYFYFDSCSRYDGSAYPVGPQTNAFLVTS